MQSIDRAMKIINMFMEHDTNSQFSITELANSCELPISSMHRILKAMMKHGMIQQDSERKLYSLGPVWLEYGLKVYDTMDYVSIIRPELEELMRSIEASVYLHKPIANEAIIIERIDCVQQTVRVHDQLGLRVPLHTGAASMVMLAHMPYNKRMEVIEANVQEDEKAAFSERLETIKIDGYVISHDERSVGITSIAAPIFNRHKQVENAVSTRLVSVNLSEERLQQVVEYIVHTGDNISRKLGYTGL